MFDDPIQKFTDGITAALGKMAGDMLTSPLGMFLIAAAAFMFVFPIARSIWRTSRWAFGGVVLLGIAAALFRPSMPKPAGEISAPPVAARTTVSSPPFISPVAQLPVRPDVKVDLLCVKCYAVIVASEIGVATRFTCPECHAEQPINAAATAYDLVKQSLPPLLAGEKVRTLCEHCGSCDYLVSGGKDLTVKCATCKRNLIFGKAIKDHALCKKEHYTVQIYSAEEYERREEIRKRGMRKGPDGTWHVRRDDEGPSPADGDMRP